MFVIGDFVWSELRKKIGDLGWWFFFFFCCGLVVVVVVVVGVVVADGGGGCGCGWLLKFAVDFFFFLMT